MKDYSNYPKHFVFKNIYKKDISDAQWNNFKQYCKDNCLDFFATDDLELNTDNIVHRNKISDILKLPISQWKLVRYKEVQ